MKMKELIFNSTYGFADLVESHIYGESAFCNYSEDILIERTLRFKKETLLHHYIETTIWNYYNRDIRKYGGDYIYYIFFFKGLFESYNVIFDYFKDIGDDEESSDEYILHNLNDNFEKIWHEHESVFRRLPQK